MTLDLVAGTVRVIGPGGSTSGTGFVVSGDGLIATCSHVVQPEASQSRGDPRPGEVAVVFGATGDEGLARIEEWRPYDAEDVAILRLEGGLPEGVRDLPLGSSAGTSDHRFQTFGFPDASPEEGIWGDGHIQGKTRIEGIEVLQISSKEVTPGFSGAPVLDTVTRRVVGMVTAILLPDQYGRMAETAFITPTETLREICPALKISDRPPYLGLDAFTEADAELFFGRKKVVDRLTESLRQEPRFLAVLGPSGSGKSSVVQAGLIPSLRDGAIPGSDRWEFIVARPSDHPFERLAEAGLDGASDGLVSALKNWVDLHPSNERLVLILDQFEELLVTCPEELRRSFLVELSEVLESDQRVTLALVMRDDFFGRFAQEAPPSLFGWVESGFVHVSSSLEKDELREIVEEPARLVGLDFEEGLFGLIVDDVLRAAPATARSTALPLLEFALTQLWERREEGLLTHHAYSAIGGVTGGLARWADQAYADLDEEMRPLARRVLVDLVHLGDESQGLPDSRRRRSLGTLCRSDAELETVHRVVQRLADARLLVTSMDKKTDEVTVEIIHDSLIREWGRLQRWLKEDRRFLAWRQEIEPRVEAWVETSPEDPKARDDGRLLRGRDLSAAESWLVERGADLSSAEREFVEAGLDLRTQEQAEEKRQRRRIIAGLAIGLAITTILAVFAGVQWQEAEEQRRAALSLQLAAQSIFVRDQGDYRLTTSGLLALESMRRDPCLEGDLALRHVLTSLAGHVATMHHEADVIDVEFSPDGTRIATASGDNTAKVWDAATGEPIATMHHEGWVRAVEFSPDGTRIATASGDNTAKVWDAATGEPIATMHHESYVYDVKFSPDGTRIATASPDNTAKVWDAATGEPIATMHHEADVTDVEFSPDGTRIATGSWDDTAKVWDAATGEPIATMHHESYIGDVESSPDGTRLATASWDNTAKVWDAATGEPIATMHHEADVTDVEFSPDGARLATASGDNTAKVWDASTGDLIATMTHKGTVGAVAFNSECARLATASGDNTAKVWNASTGDLIATMTHDDNVWDVEFSPDGSRVATASPDNTAKVWGVATIEPITTMSHGGRVEDVAFSPDGTRIATASDDNTARVWNASTGKTIATMYPSTNPYAYAVAFSPNGTRLATASQDATAKVWDVSTGNLIATMHHENAVLRVAFSPEGARLATGSWDNAAKVWNASTGDLIEVMPHEDGVGAVAFSPDGTRIATGSWDNTAKLWDASTGDLIAAMPHESRLRAVAFSPDGTRIAAASDDNIVRVWNASTGDLIEVIPHESSVLGVAFSSDGTRLATTSYDGTTKVWHIKPEDLIEEACSCLERKQLTREEWNRYLPGEPYRETCDLSDLGHESALKKIRNRIASFRP